MQINLTPDIWFSIVATIFSIIAAVLSKRAASWGKAATMVARTLEKITGRPDPRQARPTTGATLSEKVESLGNNDMAFLENQVLIAQTLRVISDDLSMMRGTGKRRLPTDTITLPKEIESGR